MFAFIRYTTKGGVLKAITEMNHMKLRGKEVFVGEAKYRRSLVTKDMKKIQIADGNRNDMIRQPPRESKPAQITPSSCPEDVSKGKRNQDPHGNGWTKKLEVAVAKENLN
ncbi:uncharacterized protein DS421_19g647490 [Arachis hypogaea]|uniref:RRM domain-containing protein n=1 Tax=Arachis hypogaea TaxID=3818 RepID=A0A6B9V6G5_ARAHY|nr:uncharacterized protein DS421_19g647490 [Arachis hypogaea]